jgi:hypothetical protein
MSYRNALDAAQARIAALEEEVARLRAGTPPRSAAESRLILVQLEAERDRALAVFTRGRRVARSLVYTVPATALAMFLLLRTDAFPSGAGRTTFGYFFMFSLMAVLTWLFVPSDQARIEAKYRLRIAEAEAEAKLARLERAETKRGRIEVDESADDDRDEAVDEAGPPPRARAS